MSTDLLDPATEFSVPEPRVTTFVDVQPEAAALAGSADAFGGPRMPQLASGAYGWMETYQTELGGGSSFDFDLASPTGGPELAPVATVEFAPANDPASGTEVEAAGVMDAIFGLLRARGLVGADPRDTFNFASVRSFGDERMADGPLDPFSDAVDPAWMGEVLASLVVGDATDAALPADTPELMVETPVDGPDGWVV